MSREAAYGALFALLQAGASGAGLNTVDRRVRLPEQMNAAELPALFMGVDRQQVAPRSGLPPRRTLGARLFLYAANPDRHTAAGIVLNGLLDWVEATLAPDPVSNLQTLGGAVRHAWVEGAIEVFEGPSGDRAAALVPVLMLVP